ncbi:MAG TPA: hypothetical protein VHM28_10035 [Anaerolineales bacterium]|jgi:hypothetical protein|nr:hypothetical protein [Anaerolineales bacterium]
MMMPKTISGWAMWLFFLLTGVFAFWNPLGANGTYLVAVLALVYAVAALFGK